MRALCKNFREPWKDIQIIISNAAAVRIKILQNTVSKTSLSSGAVSRRDIRFEGWPRKVSYFNCKTIGAQILAGLLCQKMQLLPSLHNDGAKSNNVSKDTISPKKLKHYEPMLSYNQTSRGHQADAKGTTPALKPYV